MAPEAGWRRRKISDCSSMKASRSMSGSEPLNGGSGPAVRLPRSRSGHDRAGFVDWPFSPCNPDGHRQGRTSYGVPARPDRPSPLTSRTSRPLRPAELTAARSCGPAWRRRRPARCWPPAATGVEAVARAAPGSGGAGQLKIASPSNPITWPVDETQIIESGLKPEPGSTLKVYNYADYLSPRVMKNFEKEFGVKVELSTFNDTEEAISKIASGSLEYDVYYPSYDQIAKLVRRGWCCRSTRTTSPTSATAGTSSPTRSTTRAGTTRSPTPPTPPASAGTPTWCPTRSGTSTTPTTRCGTASTPARRPSSTTGTR